MRPARVNLEQERRQALHRSGMQATDVTVIRTGSRKGPAARADVVRGSETGRSNNDVIRYLESNVVTEARKRQGLVGADRSARLGGVGGFGWVGEGEPIVGGAAAVGAGVGLGDRPGGTTGELSAGRGSRGRR